MKTRFHLVAGSVMVLAALLSGASAADVAWTGASDTDWSNGANWDGGAAPAAGDAVTIPANAANMPVLSASTPALASVEVRGSVTFRNWETRLQAGTVTVAGGGVLTCEGPFTTSEMSNRVWVVCTDFTLASGAMIDVNEKGWGSSALGRTSFGPGAGEWDGGGGAHGGFGASGHVSGSAPRGCNGATYGSFSEPTDPGSSGHVHANRSGSKPVGNGGGAVRIDAAGLATLDGTISANGKMATDGFGAGSGGSVLVVAGRIAGSGGTVTAAGGSAYYNPAFGGAGGGGRIALRYDPQLQSADALSGMTISAAPGAKWFNQLQRKRNYGNELYDADVGTVYFTDGTFLKFLGAGLTGQLRFGAGTLPLSLPAVEMASGWVRFADEGVSVSVAGDLSVTGNETRFEMGGGNFDAAASRYTFPVRRSGSVPWSLAVGGNLSVSGGAWFQVFPASTNGTAAKTGGTVAVTGDFSVSASDAENECVSSAFLACDPTDGAAVLVSARDIAVGEGARVSADMRGFAVGKGPGPGRSGDGNTVKQPNADAMRGAGHGGAGHKQTVHQGVSYGGTYDDPVRPQSPGSGGSYTGDTIVPLSGGGVVHLVASRAMSVSGSVSADALASATAGSYARFACGAGGTVLLECKTFSMGASGSVSAAGGGIAMLSANFYNGGCGGGGRIAVWTGDPFVEGETPASALSTVEKPQDWAGTFSVAGGLFVDSAGLYRKYDETDGWQMTSDPAEATVRGEDGTIRFVVVETAKPTVLCFR